MKQSLILALVGYVNGIELAAMDDAVVTCADGNCDLACADGSCEVASCADGSCDIPIDRCPRLDGSCPLDIDTPGSGDVVDPVVEDPEEDPVDEDEEEEHDPFGMWDFGGFGFWDNFDDSAFELEYEDPVFDFDKPDFEEFEQPDFDFGFDSFEDKFEHEEEEPVEEEEMEHDPWNDWFGGWNWW